ncbi:probable flavin-containing monoamine oxidase A [Aethina tumida]|uniref:probable flavin-containing monoamine oxidase A n=1 Tax=Aethina tumida TaxID=116153 RepID=UPI0021499281|nr:probable flavin-containing monoamine oxidase A [Aethina tumida]
MYQTIDYDVVIIGGGLSGITAAFTLLEKVPSLNVLILEAKDNIGGRTQNVNLQVKNGELASFDLGWRWIESDHKSLKILVDKLGLQLVSVDKIGTSVIQYKTYYIQEHHKYLHKFLNELERHELSQFVTKVDYLCQQLIQKIRLEEFDIITTGAFIETHIKNEAVKAVLHQMILSHFGISPENLQLVTYLFFCCYIKPINKQLLNTKKEFIKGGCHSICESIISIIGHNCVKTVSKVVSLIQNEEYVKVITQSEKYVTRHVIIAVPPKDFLNIKIYPILPIRKVASVRNTICGPITNFIITYPNAFWSERGFCGDYFNFDRESCINACFNVTVDGKAALFGQIFGNKVYEQTEGTRTNYRYKHIVLQQLAHVFGRAAKTPIDYCEKTWNGTDDCLIYTWGVKTEECIEVIQNTNFDRIHFCGAEASVKWYSTMNGAVETGIRTAQQILYLLRPNALTLLEIHEFCAAIPLEVIIKPAGGWFWVNWKVVIPLALIGIIGIVYKIKYQEE